MPQLDEVLQEAEKYGFDRDNFPRDFNGHTLHILQNDGCWIEDRLYFDLEIHCTGCSKSSGTAGKFHYGSSNAPQSVAVARQYVLSDFWVTGCQKT
jgi:hypothetical protein